MTTAKPPDVIELIRQQLAKPLSFEDLLAATPDAVVVTNADGAIVSVNRRTEILFGYTGQELFGRPVEVLMPERFHAEHVRLREAFLRDPRPIRRLGDRSRPLTGVCRRGTELPLSIGLALMYLNDEPLIIATIRELTDAVERER